MGTLGQAVTTPHRVAWLAVGLWRIAELAKP